MVKVNFYSNLNVLIFLNWVLLEDDPNVIENIFIIFKKINYLKMKIEENLTLSKNFKK